MAACYLIELVQGAQDSLTLNLRQPAGHPGSPDRVGSQRVGHAVALPLVVLRPVKAAPLSACMLIFRQKKGRSHIDNSSNPRQIP
jgi:hypothetical protein